MALFFLIVSLLVVLVLAFLLPTFRHRDNPLHDVNRADVNVNIARQQLQDLERRLHSNEISSEEYDQEKLRLETDLARDISVDARVGTDRVGTDRVDTSNADTNKADPEKTEHVSTGGQWLLWPMAVTVPVLAGVFYLLLGTPAAIDPANRVAIQNSETVQQQQQQVPDMRDIVVRIREQLQKTPEDARGWFMLGRAYLSLGEYQQAATALRKSVSIDDSDIDARIRLADAIALSQQGSLAGEPMELLKSALQEHPDHVQGLWLYGMAQNEGGDSQAAVATWNRLLPLLHDDPQSTAEVQQLIRNASGNAETNGAASDGMASGDSSGSSTSSVGTETGAVTVEVDVAAGLADGLSADTPVFIYAKAFNGPPMPLAVVRHTLSELPLKVTLSDAQAMIDTMKISAYKELVIGARISLSGNPVAQAGDLYQELSGVDATNIQSPVQIVISETL